MGLVFAPVLSATIPRKKSRLACLAVGCGFLVLLSACQQAPAEVDGHKVTKTQRIKGKEVNFLQSTDDDLAAVRLEAAEMKKTTDGTVFTPEEQKEHK